MSLTGKELIEEFFKDKDWSFGPGSFVERIFSRLFLNLKYFPGSHTFPGNDQDTLWWQGQDGKWYNITMAIEDFFEEHKLLQKRIEALENTIMMLQSYRKPDY